MKAARSLDALVPRARGPVLLDGLFSEERAADCAGGAATEREAPVTRGFGVLAGAKAAFCDEEAVCRILPVPRARVPEPEASCEVVVSLGILEEREGLAVLGFEAEAEGGADCLMDLRAVDLRASAPSEDALRLLGLCLSFESDNACSYLSVIHAHT